MAAFGRLLQRIGGIFSGSQEEEKPEWEYCLDEDLADFPLPVLPAASFSLTVRNLPALLRLVVLAPTDASRSVQADMATDLLDQIVPGFGAAAQRDKARVRIWPVQSSLAEFSDFFHRSMLKPEPEGNPSNWVLIAGQCGSDKQSFLVGLALWTDEPSTLGRLTLEPKNWEELIAVRNV